MIHVTSIRTVNINKYDKIYAIVRSLKSKNTGIKQLAELSPSWDLFKKYRSWVEKNEWNARTFQEKYVPQFVHELAANQDAAATLRILKGLDRDGKNIALVCFCVNEELCHRSIIAGILSVMGCNVKTDQNPVETYSQYYRAFHDASQKIELMNIQEQKRKELDNAIGMLNGCWNRIHVSDDPEEVRQLREAAYCYIHQAKKTRITLIELAKAGRLTLSSLKYANDLDFQSCMTVLKASSDANALRDFGMLAGQLIQVASNARLHKLEQRAATSL